MEEKLNLIIKNQESIIKNQLILNQKLDLIINLSQKQQGATNLQLLLQSLSLVDISDVENKNR